jgi:hypothetical protein
MKNKPKLFLFIGIGVMTAGLILIHIVLSYHPSAQKTHQQLKECRSFWLSTNLERETQLSNNTIDILCDRQHPYDRSIQRLLNISRTFVVGGSILFLSGGLPLLSKSIKRKLMQRRRNSSNRR